MIYLDNAATSFPKPPLVSRAMAYAVEHCANPGRSGHAPALEAGRIILQARERMAAFFGLDDPMCVLFTLNCTDALNLVIQGMIRPGQHVVTTSLEHNSVLRPLFHLQQSRGITWSVATPDENGQVQPNQIRRLITPRTALVIVTHASNVTGIVQPVEEIASLCQGKGLPLLVDGAQAGGILDISLPRLGADFYAFAGHKGLLGPQGIGGLLLGSDLRPLPLRQGGTGSASSELSQPKDLPDLYESGTAPTPAVAGLGASLEYLDRFAPALRRHESHLTSALLEGLRKIPQVHLLSDPPAGIPRVGVVSFNLGDMDSSEAADQLWRRGQIACRSGLHCAPYTHAFYGTETRGAVRLSIGAFNTQREIDAALRVIHNLAQEVPCS